MEERHNSPCKACTLCFPGTWKVEEGRLTESSVAEVVWARDRRGRRAERGTIGAVLRASLLGPGSTSSKDTVRWRPSQVGWRPWLLVIRSYY